MIEWIKNLFSKKYINILDENGNKTGYSINLRTEEIRQNYVIHNGKDFYVSIIGIEYDKCLENLKSNKWNLEHA